MFRFPSVSLCALTATLVGVSPALANVEEHQIEYTWDVSQGNEPLDLQFPQFDTQNGTRVLTGVTLIMDGTYDLTMWAENQEERAITQDEWFVESGLLMMFNFDGLDLGAITGSGLGIYSVDLAANDGMQYQGDDYTEWTYADVIGTSIDIRSEDFGIFRGEGLLDATMYPYLSLTIPPPPPFFWTDAKSHVHTGVFTLQYEWQPSAAAVVVTDPDPLVGGQRAFVYTLNVLPNTMTYLAASTSGTGTQWVPFLGVTIDLSNPRAVSSPVMSDDEGSAGWSGRVPASLSGRTLWLQAAQPGLKTEVLKVPVQ